MNEDPDYIVIRPGEGLPAGFLSSEMDGRWFDTRDVPKRTDDEAEESLERFRQQGGVVSRAVAVPTGRFEVREDGVVAEIWEVQV